MKKYSFIRYENGAECYEYLKKNPCILQEYETKSGEVDTREELAELMDKEDRGAEREVALWCADILFSEMEY